jgi:hypothetical protein
MIFCDVHALFLACAMSEKMCALARMISIRTVMSFAFQVPGYEALIFTGGILMSVLAWMIPMYIIPRLSK